MDKTMTKNMATMLLTLTQSDEWFRLCDNDEGIRTAEDHLQVILEKLATDNPDEMMEQVGDAVFRINNAYCSAAMLYGIRAANAIRDVSAQHLSLTMQILRQSRADTGTQGGTTQNV